MSPASSAPEASSETPKVGFPLKSLVLKLSSVTPSIRTFMRAGRNVQGAYVIALPSACVGE